MHSETCATRHPERCPIHCILPPHLLRHLARQTAAELRDLAAWAERTLWLSERLRGRREWLGAIAAAAGTPTGERRRTIYDAGGAEDLPGVRVRGEGDPPTGDPEVDEAYDGAGDTWTFWFQALGRNSIDGRGMRLDASVHYGQRYDNAFWNGAQMVYGDGDGILFNRFTSSVDVIGHELAHGVTQREANLAYHGQAGALNESFSDVFGVLVRQYASRQLASEADWLVGAGLFTARVHGRALRSMAAPGTAYDDPRLGRDPQPAHMRDYVETWDDGGGVHINSGIPNRAFHLAAIAFGGHAWERAGRIWYEALRERLREESRFADAAAATLDVARRAFGRDAAGIVKDAWREVGVHTPRRTRNNYRNACASSRTAHA